SCWHQQTLLQSAINIQWHSIPFEEECVCVCVRQRERVCVCFGFLEVFVSRLPLISLSVRQRIYICIYVWLCVCLCVSVCVFVCVSVYMGVHCGCISPVCERNSDTERQEAHAFVVEKTRVRSGAV